MNIKFLLSRSITELANHGIPTPELDARILLREAVEKDDSFVFSHPEHLITNTQYSRFRSYIRRRKKGEPIAYILDHREFFGLNFIINKNVLVPRPETEWLVEKSIAFLQNYELRIKNYANGSTERHACHPELAIRFHSRPELAEWVSGPHNNEEMLKQVRDDKINVLDMGTGSGCIIISVIKNLPSPDSMLLTPNYFASDLSQKALKIARKNAELNNVKNIKFYISDLFSNRFLHKKFDLIIANLPYVPYNTSVGATTFRHFGRNRRNRLIVDPIAFEPQNAIFANDNGMAIIKKFLSEARTRLNDHGTILLETDCRNAKEVFKFAQKEYPEAKVGLKKDLAGLDRYIAIDT